MSGGAESTKTFLEFFAGIGLVRVGLEPSGWRCVYANDVDPRKHAMHRGHFGDDDHYDCRDIWRAEEVLDRIASAPLLATASFPCTDMSLAGRRRGFEGGESSAFFGFAHVLRRLVARRPPLVMLENVMGFVTSRNGADFAAAIETLGELGYWVDAVAVDAADFLPQSRPRLFVVGVHGDVDSPRLIRRDDRASFLADPWNAALDASGGLRPQALRRAIDRCRPATGWATVPLEPPRRARYDLTDFIDFDDQQAWWDDALRDKHLDMLSPRHARQLNAWLASGRRAALTAYRRIRHGQQRMEPRFDGLAGCLRTPRGGSARQIVIAIERGETRIRWMSPREYARLQGAPDYTLPEGTHQALFGFGDAVCAPAVAWVDRNLLSPLADDLLAGRSAALAEG